MNNLRQIHLYLGCFFAPLIIFFATTGVLMEFGNGRFAPWFRYLFAIHMGQMPKSGHYGSSVFLQGFVVLMGVSLIVTVITGIILAFKYGRSTLTLTFLAAGILIPLALVLIFGK
jgi:uncharacterized iron-regulated membrane protein